MFNYNIYTPFCQTRLVGTPCHIVDLNQVICYTSIEMTSRMEKIDEIVKREVSRYLLGLFNDEIVSVTQVSVSKDLAYAKVWISALQNPDEAVLKCQNHAKDITRNLAQKLQTRKVPQLTFLIDKSTEKVKRIEELLKEIHDDKTKTFTKGGFISDRKD